MDGGESGDELTDTFLHTGHDAFLVQDELDDDVELGGDNSDDSNGERPAGALREQDRFLPIANVAKIMKKAIPEYAKIAKDARECVQECVSEFISFVTSEASDRCQLEKRKTINGEDILFAMTTLGFDNYIEPLKIYLLKYREATKGVKTIGANEMFEDPVVLNDSMLGGEVSVTKRSGPGGLEYSFQDSFE